LKSKDSINTTAALTVAINVAILIQWKSSKLRRAIRFSWDRVENVFTVIKDSIAGRAKEIFSVCSIANDPSKDSQWERIG